MSFSVFEPFQSVSLFTVVAPALNRNMSQQSHRLIDTHTHISPVAQPVKPSDHSELDINLSVPFCSGVSKGLPIVFQLPNKQRIHLTCQVVHQGDVFWILLVHPHQLSNNSLFLAPTNLASTNQHYKSHQIPTLVLDSHFPPFLVIKSASNPHVSLRNRHVSSPSWCPRCLSRCRAAW